MCDVSDAAQLEALGRLDALLEGYRIDTVYEHGPGRA